MRTILTPILPLFACSLLGCRVGAPNFASDTVSQLESRSVIVPAPGSKPLIATSQSESQISFEKGPASMRAYDIAMISCVTNRWNQLIRSTPPGRWGVAALEWRLFPDGRVSDVRVTRGCGDDQLNDIAKGMILDLAPFQEWPEEIRGLCTNGYRDVHFELSVHHD